MSCTSKLNTKAVLPTCLICNTAKEVLCFLQAVKQKAAQILPPFFFFFKAFLEL